MSAKHREESRAIYAEIRRVDQLAQERAQRFEDALAAADKAVSAALAAAEKAVAAALDGAGETKEATL